MIELKNLSKSFGRNLVLRDINFTVGEGKVISLLGPNASGKSTMIKCILGLVRPTKGRVTIQGYDAADTKGRALLSYMPQVARLAENINAIRLFQLMKDLRQSSADASALIHYFGLEQEVNKNLGELSGGTRQKVSAVLAFLFDSPIIILDEPTVGLDPVARVNFKNKVLEEKRRGKTIFFTSHIMSDVEEVADEIAFLHNGTIHYNGTPSQLKVQTGQENLERAIASYISTSSPE